VALLAGRTGPETTNRLPVAYRGLMRIEVAAGETEIFEFEGSRVVGFRAVLVTICAGDGEVGALQGKQVWLCRAKVNYAGWKRSTVWQASQRLCGASGLLAGLPYDRDALLLGSAEHLVRGPPRTAARAPVMARRSRRTLAGIHHIFRTSCNPCANKQ
jgi:hypothetical protein